MSTLSVLLRETGETQNVVQRERWPRIRHQEEAQRFAVGLAFVACLAAAAPAAFAAGLGIAGISCVSAAGTATLTFCDGEPETVFHPTLGDGRGWTVTVLDGSRHRR